MYNSLFSLVQEHKYLETLFRQFSVTAILPLGAEMEIKVDGIYPPICILIQDTATMYVFCVLLLLDIQSNHSFTTKWDRPALPNIDSCKQWIQNEDAIKNKTVRSSMIV